MTLVNLPNLYCLPSDIFDYLGIEGVQLALDDHSEATGQKIVVGSAANQGDVALTVLPLALPLLAGTVLEFDGGGAPAVVEATLTATAAVGAASLTVAPLLAALPVLAAATDNGVNAALAARLVKGCQYGTSQVKLYCCSRYDDSALATCWSANRWATYLGAKWVRSRRGQTPPKQIMDDCEEALQEMKQVRVGMLQLEDIPTRTAGWPFISNMTLDVRYDLVKARLEPQLSEGTPTQYGQFIDWNSALLLQW